MGIQSKKIKNLLIITILIYLIVILSKHNKPILNPKFNQDLNINLSYIKPSKSDIILLARLLQSESFKSSMADSIATVVLNRLDNNIEYGHCTNIKNTIFDKKHGLQFDGINTYNFKRNLDSFYIKKSIYWNTIYVNNSYKNTNTYFYYTDFANDNKMKRQMKDKFKYKIQNTNFFKL